MDLKRKLTSRKFWLTVAAILASVGTAISGFYVDDYRITVAGIICTAFSSCIYSIMEGVVDMSHVSDDTESEG